MIVFREAIIGFVTAALSIIVALAWRDYITFLFDNYVKKNINCKSVLMTASIYVVVVTIIGLIITSLLTEFQKRHEENDEEDFERLNKKAEETETRIRKIQSVSDKQITNDESLEFKRKPNKFDTVQSILGVKDDKVLRVALEDQQVDSQNRKIKKKQRDRLKSLIVPGDIGIMKGRYN